MILPMHRRMFGLALLLAPMYAFGSAPTASHPLGLSQETLTAENGGTLIAGSERILVDGVTPDGRARWRLITFRTSEWQCVDIQFLTLSGDLRSANGGCGGDQIGDDILNVSSGGGGRVEHNGGPFYSNTFDFGLPAGTTQVRVWLSDGSSVLSEARNDAFAAVWLGEATVLRGEALTSDGQVIQRAQPGP